MPNPTFFAALLATGGSMGGLSKIAIDNHDMLNPMSLSELAAAEKRALTLFRKVLVVCSSLFSISIYWFIAPRVSNGLAVVVTWTVVYVSILLAAIMPAKGRSFIPHVVAAQSMGAGMLVLAYVFSAQIEEVGGAVELSLAVLMTALAVLTYVDKRRFIFYELPFIYLNHITIVVACLALIGK